MNIVIFGAGSYGTALGQVLTNNGHTVNYYDPYKNPDQNLSVLMEHSDVNILAAPSAKSKKTLLFIPIHTPLICASKGFLSLEPFQSFKDFSVLSGGAFSADLIAQKPTTLTGTSPLITQLFSNSWLTIEETTDVLGVMICGALKNIYAIGAGYYHLKPGQPDFDQYIETAIVELRLVLSMNGCNVSTSLLSCGLHDLAITCASPASRNYAFGTQLHQEKFLTSIKNGAIPATTAEGLSAIRAIPKSSISIPAEATVLNTIAAIVQP